MTRRERVDLGVLACLGAAVIGVAAWSASWEDSRTHAGMFAAALAAGPALWAAAGAWVLWRRPRGAISMA